MSKLKIGVFGGHRGSYLASLLSTHPDAELVAVCDKFEPVLDKVREDAAKNGWDIACYTNFDDFIKHDMDAVVLANYATEHAPFAIRCLNAGMHVLSEVMPSETPAQMVELIETVERTGLVYAYAENYCYMKPSFEMWLRYQAGDIGEVQYGEAEYIHDCSAEWANLTYGEKDHWRNREYATFYCTHSLGPLLMITGQRPVRVVGFETNPNREKKQMDIGCIMGAGIEMVTLENGAVLKSVHGYLKHEPAATNFMVYGTKGMMESDRYGSAPFNQYIEGEKLCQGDWKHYDPEIEVAKDAAVKVEGHGGSDFYPTHFFIEKILGREDGKWSIDVYQASDMGMCGILAHRSAISGNTPFAVPDFRNKEERDAYRNDNACTSPEVAGDQVLPLSAFPRPDFPDSLYDHVRKVFLGEEEL